MKRILWLALIAVLISCAKEPQTFEELTAAGNKAFLDEDYLEARTHFLKALQQKPTDRATLYFCGLSYFRDVMYDSAAFYLKRADLIHPDDREINLALYPACFNGEDWECARKSLRTLIKTGDSEDDHLVDLANLSVNMSDFPYALYYYKALHRKDPENIDYYFQISNAAAEIGSLGVSIAFMDTAEEEFGPRDGIYLNRGTYLAADKDYPAAEKEFRRLLALDTTSVVARVNLANVLASQSADAKQQEAYDLYKELPEDMLSEPFIDSTLRSLEDHLRIKKN